MKQTLHIFKKDVRHLWPQIAVALVLAVSHAILDVLSKPTWNPSTERINQLAGFSSLLLVLAWWNLIAAAIHEEVLPGDRQFWVTRPYSWKSLLGAKILFILAFVNLPLLVSDCFILGTQGFPIIQNLPDLLLRQPRVSAWLILPALVLATVTSGLGQFVLAILAVCAGIVSEAMLVQALFVPQGASVGVDFVNVGNGTLLLVIFVVAVFWQFAKRQTASVRAVLAVFLFVISPAISAIPWPRHQPETGRLPEIHLSFDFSPRSDSEPRSYSGDCLMLPVKVSGLRSGTSLIGHGEAKIFSAARVNAQLEQTNGRYFLDIRPLDAAMTDSLRSRPANLRVSLHVTEVTNEIVARVPAQQPSISLPQVGICEKFLEGPNPGLICRSGVRASPSTLVTLEYPGFRSGPASMGTLSDRGQIVNGLSPVYKWMTTLGDFSGPPDVHPQSILSAWNHPGAQWVFTVQHPIGEATRDLEQSNVDLSPYLLPEYH